MKIEARSVAIRIGVPLALGLFLITSPGQEYTNDLKTTVQERLKTHPKIAEVAAFTLLAPFIISLSVLPQVCLKEIDRHSSSRR